MEGGARGLGFVTGWLSQKTLPLEPQRAMTRGKLNLCRAVRDVWPALLLMALTCNYTFKATENHDERCIGLVEGEGGLASFLADECNR